MAIVFPASPNLNEIFTEGSISYKCVGTDPIKWIGLGITPADRLVEGSNSLEINGSNNLVWTGNNVGIGLTNPDRPLSVGDMTSGLIARFIGPTNNMFINNDRSGVIDLFSSGSGDSLCFGTQNTEALRIDSSGRLLINTDNSRIVQDHVGNGPQGLIQIEATNSDAIMSIISAGTADVNRCGTINLGRHRNSTVGDTPTIVNNGDALGAVVFSGGDGTDMRCVGATIHVEVDGTPGENDMPGALIFSTTPDGSSSPYQKDRLRITSDGSVSIGGFSTPGALLHLRDSNNTTKGAAQLKISKGIGSGAAPISVSRADSYIHLGGSEWGSGANGLYIMGFGYTGGETGTGLPAYIGYRETSTSGYTLGDLTFGTRPNTDGTNAGRERMKITSKGVRQYPCANDSTFAYQGNYQQLSGKKQLIGSGNFTDIVAHGHSCSYLLQYHLLQNDNNSLGGGPGTAYLHVRYGSSGYSNHVHQVGGMNGGSLNSPEIVYINSGSKLTFRASWSGSDPVFLYWHLSGCGNTLLTAL